MPDVTIYTSMFCGFCHRAKHLLEQKGVAYNEIDVGMTPGARHEMTERADGATSVPQIFIGETHVGGCDDLYELEYDGKLDAMLEAA